MHICGCHVNYLITTSILSFAQQIYRMGPALWNVFLTSLIVMTSHLEYVSCVPVVRERELGILPSDLVSQAMESAPRTLSLTSRGKKLGVQYSHKRLVVTHVCKCCNHTGEGIIRRFSVTMTVRSHH